MDGSKGAHLQLLSSGCSEERNSGVRYDPPEEKVAAALALQIELSFTASATAS